MKKSANDLFALSLYVSPSLWADPRAFLLVRKNVVFPNEVPEIDLLSIVKSVVLGFHSVDAKGKEYNPFTLEYDDEPMGVMIVKRTSQKYSHSYENGTNKISIEI